MRSICGICFAVLFVTGCSLNGIQDFWGSRQAEDRQPAPIKEAPDTAFYVVRSAGGGATLPLVIMSRVDGPAKFPVAWTYAIDGATYLGRCTTIHDFKIQVFRRAPGTEDYVPVSHYMLRDAWRLRLFHLPLPTNIPAGEIIGLQPWCLPL